MFCRGGLGYRLGWGIGVQRGGSSLCFGSLGVGRGFGRLSFKLGRRFKRWGFEFGVQGYALGFWIEDVWHDSKLRDSCLGDSVTHRRVASGVTIDEGCCAEFSDGRMPVSVGTSQRRGFRPESWLWKRLVH